MQKGTHSSNGVMLRSANLPAQWWGLKTSQQPQDPVPPLPLSPLGNGGCPGTVLRRWQPQDIPLGRRGYRMPGVPCPSEVRQDLYLEISLQTALEITDASTSPKIEEKTEARSGLKMGPK